MKRVALMFVAVAAAAGAGAWWWQSHRPANEHVGELRLYGNVEIREVELAFSLSERIASLEVQEGAVVQAGQRLGSLRCQRFQHRLDRARAQVTAQRQTLARLESGSRPEEIDKARAEVEARAAERDKAQRTFRRLQDLASRELAADEDADEAEAAYRAAKARLRSARETLKLVLAGPRQEEVAAARATLAAQQASRSLAEQDVADCHLDAPAGGIIRERLLEPGDMAGPQIPAFTLALTDPAWVRAYVPEPELGRIRPGTEVEVSTDSYPEQRYRGWVGAISPRAEFTPKSVETPRVRTDLVYQVRIHVCNPRDELRLGMPATVHIPLAAAPAPEAGRADCDGE